MPEKPPVAITPTELGADQPSVQIMGEVHQLLDDSRVQSGARWTLSEPGRQLDANLVHLPPGQRVDTHTEPDLDVVLVVVAGAGVLGDPDGAQPLAQGNLVWLPRGSTRNLAAGEEGLSYLTVHRRRPGLQIKQKLVR